MIFVNEIAEIVHTLVDFYSGAANKNIGDAFLLVWKFQDDQIMIDPLSKELTVKKINQSKQRADMSIVSFLRIIGDIKRSRKMNTYKDNEELNARMPNYSVKLGFGLHIGWAIEGAIGSDFKIDASYLSPNVNMSSTLEAATKAFGTPILLTGELFNTFTDKTKDHMRQIDCCRFKGKRYDLYTCDISTDFLELEDEKSKIELTSRQVKAKRVSQRIKRNRFRKRCLDGQMNVSDHFEDEKLDIKQMRDDFAQQFRDVSDSSNLIQTGLL